MENLLASRETRSKKERADDEEEILGGGHGKDDTDELRHVKYFSYLGFISPRIEEDSIGPRIPLPDRRHRHTDKTRHSMKSEI